MSKTKQSQENSNKTIELFRRNTLKLTMLSKVIESFVEGQGIKGRKRNGAAILGKIYLN